MPTPFPNPTNRPRLAAFLTSHICCCQLPPSAFICPSAQAALEDAHDSTTLGDLWFDRGQLKEARDEHRRALKIREKWLPPGDRDVAESLESLGNIAIREVSGDGVREFFAVWCCCCCLWWWWWSWLLRVRRRRRGQRGE